MPSLPKLPGAKCESCPLRDLGDLVPPTVVQQPLAAIVGEQPGVAEFEQDAPYVGPAGRLLNHCLSKAELPRSRFTVLNAVNCYGPRLSRKEYAKAAECCAPAVREAVGPSRALTLGRRPLQALTGHARDIEDWFGWPLPGLGGGEVFPNYEPAFALRNRAYMGVFQHIVQRGAYWLRGKLREQWPPIFIEPDEAALAALLRIAQAPLVGFDVETAGKSPMFDTWLALGVASEAEAVCLTWPPPPAHLAAMRQILSSPATKTAHNAQHDLLTLEAQGVEVTGPLWDTLLVDAAEFPLLPHNLSFVAGREFAQPRWKSVFGAESEHKGSAKFAKAPIQVLLDYCAKDAWTGAKLARVQQRRVKWTPTL